MLDRVGGVLGEVGRIVRSSHERWGGRGYPDGLVGEDIPVESTIIAVCDAFNAMTTNRSYRLAMSVDAAIGELRANSGSQFSPLVASTLIGLIQADRVKLGPATPASPMPATRRTPRPTEAEAPRESFTGRFGLRRPPTRSAR